MGFLYDSPHGSLIMACITIVPLVTLNSLKKFSYVMIARKELGLDHLSDPDTQNLREFEFGLYRF